MSSWGPVLTGNGHPSPFCQKEWGGRALLGQPFLPKRNGCALLNTTSFWNIIIHWTSPDDLTEKTVSPKPPIKWWWWKKLVKWQKFKTALCDLTKKVLPSNFVNRFVWHKSSNQSGGQIHGWIFLNFFFYYISFYSIFCRLSCFHCEWPQLATILISFNLSFVTKSKSLIF